MSATKEKLKHIDQLHFEHRLWSSGAGFYADELGIYQGRLEEIASKNNSGNIPEQIEHFQNQFIIQKEQLDILTHDIMMHDRSLSHYAQKHPVAIDHVLFADHAVLRSKNEAFVKLFQELKSEFTAFLERHL
jgi:hypothetical protein